MKAGKLFAHAVDIHCSKESTDKTLQGSEKVKLAKDLKRTFIFELVLDKGFLLLYIFYLIKKYIKKI